MIPLRARLLAAATRFAGDIADALEEAGVADDGPAPKKKKHVRRAGPKRPAMPEVSELDKGRARELLRRRGVILGDS
jgi:hypothetical protein